MNDSTPGMSRGLFGYRPTFVHQAISYRDILVRLAQGRAKAAEARVSSIEADLAAAKGGLREREAEIARLMAELQTRVDPGSISPEVTQTLKSAEEYAARISDRARKAALEHIAEAERRLAAAQDSAAQIEQQAHSAAEQRLAEAQRSAALIVERARVDAEQRTAMASRHVPEAEHNLAEIEERWRALQAATDRFIEWRDSLAPSMADAQTRLEEVRARVVEIPELLRSAFTPLAESATSAGAEVGNLLGNWSPPPIADQSDRSARETGLRNGPDGDSDSAKRLPRRQPNESGQSSTFVSVTETST
jgi:chromosome segregation ATPase